MALFQVSIALHSCIDSAKNGLISLINTTSHHSSKAVVFFVCINAQGYLSCGLVGHVYYVC